MSKYQKYIKVKQLPKMPQSISPLDENDVDVAVLLGGLSILGSKGYMCPIVTLMMGNEEDAWGWSLCLGNPEQKTEEPYYFQLKKNTVRGTEIPNTMIYYQAKVDKSLLAENVDKKVLEEIIAYVLPHISDDGPPPAYS